MNGWRWVKMSLSVEILIWAMYVMTSAYCWYAINQCNYGAGVFSFLMCLHLLVSRLAIMENQKLRAENEKLKEFYDTHVSDKLEADQLRERK